VKKFKDMTLGHISWSRNQGRNATPVSVRLTTMSVNSNKAVVCFWCCLLATVRSSSSQIHFFSFDYHMTDWEGKCNVLQSDKCCPHSSDVHENLVCMWWQIYIFISYLKTSQAFEHSLAANLSLCSCIGIMNSCSTLVFLLTVSLASSCLCCLCFSVSQTY